MRVMMSGLLAILLVVGVVSTSAHHSFVAEYNSAAPVTLTGVVSKVDWTNPHTYVYIDVKDSGGKVVSWAFEGYPPNTLKRTGFTRDTVKVGMTITVTGWHARDDSPRAAGREITLPDGAKVFLGPPA